MKPPVKSHMCSHKWRVVYDLGAVYLTIRLYRTYQAKRHYWTRLGKASGGCGRFVRPSIGCDVMPIGLCPCLLAGLCPVASWRLHATSPVRLFCCVTSVGLLFC